MRTNRLQVFTQHRRHAIPVGAVYEGVNELRVKGGKGKSPPQLRRGGRDMKKKVRSHLVGADGVVLVKRI